MKKETAIERKIQRIKRDLAKLGDMRPGSLSLQTRNWGGKYCQLSYTHRGKGHTEYVPKKRQEKVQRQTANYKKFRELTKEWVELAVQLCKLKTHHDKDPPRS